MGQARESCYVWKLLEDINAEKEIDVEDIQGPKMDICKAESKFKGECYWQRELWKCCSKKWVFFWANAFESYEVWQKMDANLIDLLEKIHGFIYVYMSGKSTSGI